MNYLKNHFSYAVYLAVMFHGNQILSDYKIIDD